MGTLDRGRANPCLELGAGLGLAARPRFYNHRTTGRGDRRQGTALRPLYRIYLATLPSGCRRQVPSAVATLCCSGAPSQRSSVVAALSITALTCRQARRPGLFPFARYDRTRRTRQSLLVGHLPHIEHYLCWLSALILYGLRYNVT